MFKGRKPGLSKQYPCGQLACSPIGRQGSKKDKRECLSRFGGKIDDKNQME